MNFVVSSVIHNTVFITNILPLSDHSQFPHMVAVTEPNAVVLAKIVEDLRIQVAALDSVTDLISYIFQEISALTAESEPEQQRYVRHCVRNVLEYILNSIKS